MRTSRTWRGISRPSAAVNYGGPGWSWTGLRRENLSSLAKERGMPKIAYKQIRLSASSVSIVEKANEIIGEYSAQGYSLSLRQLYYQFVARDLLPNTVQSYKRL